MKRIIILFLIPCLSLAQKGVKRFTLPQSAKPHQYSSTNVLVKLKKEFVNVFSEGGNPNPIPQLAKSIKPIISEKQSRKNQSRIAPRLSASNIDIAHYYEIEVTGNNIEQFINRLYSTGYFELVEPDYVAQLHYTPNDPLISNQYYLNKIRAFQAWDITKGSEELVIGIVDTGGDLDHPDLASKLYIDPNDPVDGIDNDNDGFVDNNRGWDFMGADTLNISNTSFVGDNDPNNPNGGLGSHGTAVAGCAAASTDNGLGIAGVGFNTKILFTKHAADNQGANKGGIYKGYSGILYAASHGAKIINCSWGGPFRSQIQQDLISYITLDLGCLVVASAGNDATSTLTYPASYDYVLSVAGSDEDDSKASFSNYGTSVDITAPGKNIRTTFFNNTFTTIDGTSFSSPIVAGAAALVWANRPEYTPIQLEQQLRVTADPAIYDVVDALYDKKLGKGRLDIENALLKNFPSIRASNPKFLNASGTIALPGQDGFLSMDLTNFLVTSSPGLTVNVVAAQTGLVTISNGEIRPGQLSTNQTVNNNLNPVSMKVSANVPTNTIVDLVITFTDGEYSDYQYLSFIVNPSFIDIDDNTILTTLASNGRIGFENPSEQSNGSGFVFNNDELLFEMGLIMGASTSTLFNNVRGTNNSFNQDFIIDQKIKEISPGERSFSEIFGKISDNGTSKTVSVEYRSLVWKEEPFDRFVILEYKVKNISTQPLSGFHFALFADWDITDQGGGDVANWEDNLKLGYVFPAQADDKPHAGIKLLKGITPEYFAIDNDQTIPGVPFGLYDGFTDAEKIQTISSGISRTMAGTTSGEGNDVSHVIGAGPYDIAPEQEITVAFALVVGVNFEELKFAAAQADTAYNFLLEAIQPTTEDVSACYGSTATINASGATQVNWYNEFTGGDPIFSGTSFTTGNLFHDTVFYVSNAEESYESVRVPAHVSLKANPTVLASGSTTICNGTALILSVAEADQYLWSTGATTQSIEVTEGGNYSVNVVDNALGCNSTSPELAVTINPSPFSEFQADGELKTLSPISFINSSTGGINYKWTFGDGLTSTEVNPTHIYTTTKEYTVSLLVTNELGCTSNSTLVISVITGIEEKEFQIYPIPFNEFLTFQTEWENFEYTITDLTGKEYKKARVTNDSGNNATVELADLSPGTYLITISNGAKQARRRIIKY